MTYWRMILLASAAMGLCACGGGAGGSASGISATPPPPPPSAPAGEAVTIFQSPATQEFAAVGGGDDLRIRYDAASNHYEVMAEGRGWERLVDDPLSSPALGNPNTGFAFAGAVPNQSFFMLRAHFGFSDLELKYQYSNLAAWSRSETLGSAAGVRGYTAFGMATPTGGVPLSGSATYQGKIEGISTVPFTFDYGQFGAGTVDGTVTLNFNFAGGALTGNIHPYLYGSTGRYDLGVLAFSNTVFGVGSTSYSGKFATSVGGPNAFSGLFTGPAAQEIIGKWTFPFISPIDGTAVSAAGAWIAKKP